MICLISQSPVSRWPAIQNCRNISVRCSKRRSRFKLISRLRSWFTTNALRSLSRKTNSRSKFECNRRNRISSNLEIWSLKNSMNKTASNWISSVVSCCIGCKRRNSCPPIAWIKTHGSYWFYISFKSTKGSHLLWIMTW